MNKAKLGHVIGVCDLALGALGAVATLAFIQNTPSRVAANTVSDETSERAITLHKYTGTVGKNGTTNPPDDSTLTPENKPLKGISFNVTKVTPVAGKTIDATDPSTFTKTTTTFTGTTGDDGSVTVSLGSTSAADGYYLVTELQNDAIKQAADPFIVHVPMTTKTTTADGSTASTLTYNVNVFPKNQVNDNLKLNPTKYLLVPKDNPDTPDVDEAGTETKVASVPTGSSVSWNLQIDRPADIHGSETIAGDTSTSTSTNGDGSSTSTTTKEWKTYASTLELADYLDPASMSDPEITQVVISTPNTNGGAATETTLTKDTDYKVTITEKDADHDGKTAVVVTLTDAGIKKFAQAATDSTLQATLSTKVTASSAAEVPNTFETHYHGTMTPGTDTTTEKTPGPDDPGTPKVYFGNIDITKETMSGDPLAKATFTLYSDKDAKKPVLGADNKPVTAVSGADGKVSFTGLEVDVNDKNTEKYYVVETDAPAGYDVDGQIHEVTATQDTTNDLTVKDNDNLMPNLPLTGSQARILFYAMTTGLIVVGAAGVYIIKRRQNA